MPISSAGFLKTNLVATLAAIWMVKDQKTANLRPISPEIFLA